MTDAELRSALQAALDHARAQSAHGTTLQAIHAGRSRDFVNALAEQFRQRYAKPLHAVFSKHITDNRSAFKLNELMYDIHVCELGQAGKQKLPYVKRAIWQVESELAKDAREAVIDFSKLVAGSAEFKLFIGPQVAAAERPGTSRRLRRQRPTAARARFMPPSFRIRKIGRPPRATLSSIASRRGSGSSSEPGGPPRPA